MTPTFRRVAVFVGTAALAAGAGIGVAASGDTNTPEPSRSTAPGMTRGAPGDDGLSSLSSALGVSETQLRQAMESVRQSSGQPQDLAAALADELGVPEDKVRDALESAMPQRGGPPPGAPDGRTAPQDGTTRQS